MTWSEYMEREGYKEYEELAKICKDCGKDGHSHVYLVENATDYPFNPE